MAMIRPETEMKDSGVKYIGLIPRTWKIVQLKYCTDCLDGKRIPIDASLRKSGIYPYWGAGKIMDYVDDYIFDERLVLLGEDGAPFFDDFRPVSHLIDGKVWVNNHIHVLRTKDNVVDSYLVHALNSVDYHEYINGSILNKLTQSNMNRIKIPLPSYREQQAIADYLDETCSKIDEIIAEAKASIDEYKELKQSVIFEAVTKGLDKNVEMKDSGYDFIGDIPSKWEMCKVRHLGTAQNGISIGGDAFGSGYSFVSYGDVYKNYSLPKTVDKLVRSSEEDRKRYSVEKGDWFFTRTSETIEEVGFSCVCEETIPDAVFAGFLIRVRPFNNRIYTRFAKYYFRSNHLRTFFVKEMNLVTRASLAQGLLKDAPVVVPPYDEQIEIANYLENKCTIIDGVIKDKESTIKDLESYKKSLIYEVVTGKRRVV